jgi:hypothetical protein
MKTSELRIGSWVIVKPFTQTIGDTTMSQEHPQICQITCIQKVGDSAVVQVNDNIIVPIPIEHIIGIPLNEKILKKVGFDDSKYKKGYMGIEIMAGLMISDFVLTKPGILGNYQNHIAWEYRCGNYTFFNQLKHVHNFQNLFISMVGIELDFSFLLCADVVMNFEEGDPNPIIKIKLSDN